MLKVEEESNNLNQISLTGVRAITMIGLLSIAPRTLDELKEAFIDMKLLEKDSSDDILRIDLNTLKVMGCEVTRACKSTNYKYVLKKHPFSLDFTIDDYKILKRIYNKIKDTLNLNTLLAFDELFKKLASFIFDDEIKEALLGISNLKHYKTDFIRELIADCNNKNTLKLVYKKNTSDESSVKEIAAQKLVMNNNKLYLYGYDTNKKRNVTLNVNRILSVQSRKQIKNDIEKSLIKIKFLLKDFGINSQLEEEFITEVTDTGFLVEGNYYNEFVAIQRILSFGDKCTVIEPVGFKNIIISKLKEMRLVYEN